MTRLPATFDAKAAPKLGLIVLQSDETIEADFRHLFPPDAELLVSRVSSGDTVTPQSLAEMHGHLAAAAALFPPWVAFSVIGYGCTSGTAEIGVAKVARQVCRGANARAVTEPVSALIAACRVLGIARLALVSPYVAPVSARLCAVLKAAGIATPAFGSFEIADEARVARIDAASIRDAAVAVAGRAEVDALFLSCTNLRTLGLIADLEARLGLPVLASNQVLAWHMARLAEIAPTRHAPGRLFAHDRP